MRTTLRIDDDVLEAARSLARMGGRSLGDVISDLVRRGLSPRSEPSAEDGFPVFSVSRDASPLTLEAVRKAQEPEE